MGKWTTTLLVAIFGVWTGTAAAAAGLNPPGEYSLTLGGGYQVFEGNQNLKDRPSLSLGLGYNFNPRWGLEGTFRFVSTETASGPKKDAEVYNLHLDLLHHFSPRQRLVPYLAAGAGVYATDLERGGTDQDLLLDYGGGLKYFLNNSWALRLDLRHIVDVNSSDKAKSRSVYSNLSTAAGLSYVFGEGTGPLKTVGQVLDSMALPTVASENSQDGDLDHVPDLLDKCPGTPRGELVDESGCQPGPEDPFYLPINPSFGTGLAVIGGWPMEEAEPLAIYILKHPGRKFVIEGHTDDQGPAEYNARLTQRQAESAVKYLTDHFRIPAGQIQAKGYGEERPVASNATPEGRERNRRFVLYASSETNQERSLMSRTAVNSEGILPSSPTGRQIY